MSNVPSYNKQGYYDVRVELRHQLVCDFQYQLTCSIWSYSTRLQSSDEIRRTRSEEGIPIKPKRRMMEFLIHKNESLDFEECFVSVCL